MRAADDPRHVGAQGARDATPLYSAAIPKVAYGVTQRVRTGHGNLYITINRDDERPMEILCSLGKAGGCDSANVEAISRLVSLALRWGVPARAVVEELSGITCCPAWDEGDLVRSTPDAVALALARSTEAPEEVTARRERLLTEQGPMLPMRPLRD